MKISRFLLAVIVLAIIFCDLAFADDSSKADSTYFKPGIELNYLVYHSGVKNFDNYSFINSKQGAAAAGLFFRIRPEYGFFTTGAYVKWESLIEGFVPKDLEKYGINIISVDFIDLSWSRFSVEIPLLFSLGSEKLKFTSGTLLDFYVFNEVDLQFNEKAPMEVVGHVLKSDNDTPFGDLYVVLGLDVDITRHWGAGIKCLIWGTSLGGAKELGLYDILGIEPARFQTRISAYFVF
ncbi:hypothetical protein R83H12_02433 [Fibrobacteria bacterium R8-3-H12]